MRRSAISLLKLLYSSQNTPLRHIVFSRRAFPEGPRLTQCFQTHSYSTPPIRHHTKESETLLEKSFDAASTTQEILATFESLEKSLTSSDFKLGIASLRVAQHLESVGSEDRDQALSFALRALKIFDADENRDMCGILLAKALHLVGCVTYELGRFADSLDYFNRADWIVSSFEKDNSIDDEDVRMIAHAVNLQLANTKAALGMKEEAIVNLRKCLEIKEGIFDAYSKEIGVGYRDLSEAYASILNFKEALPLCEKALEIHKSQLGVNSLEIARDRRLLGVIYTGLKEHEKASIENELSQNVLKNRDLSLDLLHAEIDAANIHIALGKYEDAVKTLKKVIKNTDEESNTKAIVLITLAKALCNQEKIADAKSCIEISCNILTNNEERCPLEVAEAYTEISMLCESLNEFDPAVSLLQRSLSIVEKFPQEQHMIGNISARIGWLLLLNGKVAQAVSYLESAVERMKKVFGPKHFGVGYIYDNLGAAYMEMERPQKAVEIFALAKDAMDAALGPNHDDSIQCLQSLANAYSDIGSYPIALEFQQQVIDAWRNQGPSAEDELKEATRLLEELKKKAYESMPQNYSSPVKNVATAVSSGQK